MKHLALLLICTVLAGSAFAKGKVEKSVPPAAATALARVTLGQTEAEVKKVLIPVSRDWGRVYYGGTGSGRLYFQLSEETQVWIEMGPGPDFRATAIGSVEEKRPWQHHDGDSITVAEKANKRPEPMSVLRTAMAHH